MTITYSFKIKGMNKLLFYIDEDDNRYDNVITQIDYYYSGTDDDNVTSIYHSSISLPKPKTTEYKKYDDLKEEDIVLWIETLINPDDIILMQTVISKNIENAKTKASILPWLV